jgi:hypothetical protein
MTNLPELMELSDAELDAVAAGAGQANGGLIAVNVSDIPITVQNNHVLQNFLNSNAILNNSLNHDTVVIPIGIAVGVLGLAIA